MLVTVVASVGRDLAPHNPVERRSVVQAGDEWIKPPVPILKAPGFPLGTDSLGRDNLSRLLWAVRPTMIMVSIVAAARLILGAAIGMAAGWSSGRVGRVLDAAIGGALSIPILMVALAVIAAVGAEAGLPAFIAGLAATGWAETARVVRERTRAVRGELYVEAARSLGESDLQILLRHIWRQVRPMVWMLFSVEISSTMMVVAGLGFLGYYIGGDIWIEIGDYVAGRTSGMPELGQMLATSLGGIASLGLYGLPWTMFSVGAMVSLIVLGFNLLGEGLRLRLSRERVGRWTILSDVSRRLGWWFEERVTQPAKRLAQVMVVRFVAAVLAAAIVVGGIWWWRAAAVASDTRAEPEVILDVPGGHPWASDWHDPYGTLWTEAPGPRTGEAHLLLQDQTGFYGGPAVSAEGTLYVGSKGGTLYALNPEGHVLWQAEVPAAVAGTPALSAEGTIYVVDKEGGLSSFTPAGELRWIYRPERAAGALAGPIVSPEGTIYYATGNRVEAVSAEGALLWEAETPYEYRLSPVQLGPDGELLFWEEIVLDARDGSPIDLGIELKQDDLLDSLGVPARLDHYIVGADGRTYFRSEHIVTEWRPAPEGAEIVQSAAWDFRAVGRLDTPAEAGVTRDGLIWLFYSSYETHIVWQDITGRVLGVAEPAAYRGWIVAVDRDTTVYFCGQRDPYEIVGLVCFAFERGSDVPLWQVSLQEEGLLSGGALVPGALYVAIDKGFLYAIREGK